MSNLSAPIYNLAIYNLVANLTQSVWQKTTHIIGLDVVTSQWRN